METMELLKLAGVIILGYFVLKFIWGAAKGIVKLVVAVIIIVGGIYFIKPELLHNVFGKDKVENIANDIESETMELVDEGKSMLMEQKDSLVEDATDSLKKVVE